MSRRTFLQTILTLAGGIALPGITKSGSIPDQWRTLQTFPVAGFQYHQGETIWPQLAADQTVTLIREPENPYDQRAVRLDWRGQTLGYVPRDENAAVSQLMDRGEKISALITGLKKSNNPWERITVEVRWWA